jgi:hypothetical protein
MAHPGLIATAGSGLRLTACSSRGVPGDRGGPPPHPARAMELDNVRNAARAARASGVFLAFAGVALGALLLGGCDAPAPGGGVVEAVVSDSAGVRIFRFPASALEIEAPRQLQPEPDVRIGVVEGPAEYQWTRPTAAVRLQAGPGEGGGVGEAVGGGFAVAEGTPAEIRIFDAAGNFVRRIGAPGDGPGEFRNPVALAPAADGGVVVWDARHRRRSHFDARGALVSEATLQDAAPFRSLRRVVLLSDGSGRTLVFGSPDDPDAGANRGHFRELLEIRVLEDPLTPAARLLRVGGTLLGRILGNEQAMTVQSDAAGTVMTSTVMSQWYWGRLFTWAAPEGVWAADRVGMELRHYRAGGRLDRVVRVDAQGPEATRARIDSLEAEELARWAAQMGDQFTDEMRSMIEADQAERSYPPYLPALDAVFSDARGNPWIGLPSPPTTPTLVSGFPAIARWLVFGPGAEPDGDDGALALEGVLELPPSTHPLWADDDGVLLVRVDAELGVPYLEWYRYRQ